MKWPSSFFPFRVFPPSSDSSRSTWPSPLSPQMCISIKIQQEIEAASMLFCCLAFFIFCPDLLNSVTRVGWFSRCFQINSYVLSQFLLRNSHCVIQMSLQHHSKKTQIVFCSLFILNPTDNPSTCRVQMWKAHNEGQGKEIQLKKLRHQCWRERSEEENMHLQDRFLANCLCKEWGRAPPNCRGLKRHQAAEQWVPCGKLEPGLTTKEDLAQREEIRLAFPPAPGARRLNLVLLIVSWGDSKELLDSPSSGPGIPFYVILADWKHQSKAINLFLRQH